MCILLSALPPPTHPHQHTHTGSDELSDSVHYFGQIQDVLISSFSFLCCLFSPFQVFSSHSFLPEPPSDKAQIISLICNLSTNEQTPKVASDSMLHCLGLLVNTVASLKRKQKNKNSSFLLPRTLSNPCPVSYTHLTLPTNVSMCRSRWSPYH